MRKFQYGGLLAMILNLGYERAGTKLDTFQSPAEALVFFVGFTTEGERE
jgi:hypothetical protein